jgi:prolyl-tRNA synthetase
MKDGYSFDLDESGLDKQYQANYQAYQRIFQRCGLEYLAVNADAGAIGGSINKEFMILADSGEDTVLRCDTCGYAANAERAEIGYTKHNAEQDETPLASEMTSTPNAHTVQQVCDFLHVDASKLIKTILVTCDNKPYAALIRGDRELNLSKLGRILGGETVLATPEVIIKVTGAPVGFAGPVGLKDVRIIADTELKASVNMVVGANQSDAHRVNVTPDVDFHVDEWADIRTAAAGDCCGQADCTGHYLDAHGIEVGHIFKLGTKYSKAMHAQVQNEQGEMQDIVMGCYGLGVSRTVAAAIEAHHDQDGILWPVTIAPFEVVIIPVNSSDETQRKAAESLYKELKCLGIDVLLDDRDERSGVKFKDADLVGYPVRVIAGRSLAENKVEISLRRQKTDRTLIPVDEAAGYIQQLIQEEKDRLLIPKI